ncbi:MAG: glycosyl hydrolase [Pyrinomonadaceae bacterium]
MSKKIFLLFIICFGVFSLSAQTSKNTSVSENDGVFKPMKWRSIGPFRGGRSNTAYGVIGDSKVYYMGTTGGGVWKTEDAGVSWRNISDGFFKTGSVGAIAVAASDANVVYVGMGEHAVRGVMTHSGDGVYKSTDAGKTWKKMGLDATRHISRIIVDPKNADIVYVAAQGALYEGSKERGIYKSTDGGANWKNVLYVDEKTGAAELSMDANNSRVLYAAMWEHGRLPWKVISGGAGSGLYKSTDSGTSWEKMTEGLPTELGKMAIAVSPSNSEKVYALIESDSEKDLGGLFVSNDAGKKWKRISDDNRLTQRAWYYIELFIDPKDENTVYVLSAPALRSNDGGKAWETLSGTHGDYHNLWINPDNPLNMIISNDGGAAITFNKGKTWSQQTNQPTGQFYRINVDNGFPYRIYGGQQDYGSVAIASRELGGSGISAASWTASAGGESSMPSFDPDNPNFVMGGSYQGTIELLDVKAQASTNVMAAPIQYLGMDAKDIKYRFNWSAPILWSKWESNTFYHGSQYLLKTSDNGRTWKEISPDLTRNEKEKQGKGGGPYTNEAVGAENYGTLAYVLESPLEKGVIWTGSDDGRVQVTRDGGASWKNVTPKGLEECLVNAIEVSPFDKATAYIATTRYKFNDFRPGLYKTTDYGNSWTKIDNGIPANAFTRVVREDTVRKDLLFAGTELGLYISWNGGKNWSPFQLNLPITPITDLKIHRGDLIASTSGRAFWILDDLNILRQYKKEMPAFSVYQPADAYFVNGSSELDKPDEDFDGTNRFRGVNPANGITVYYNLPELKKDENITLEVRDLDNNLVRTFTSKENKDFKEYDGGPNPEIALPKEKGLNRFVWDMRYRTIPGVENVYIEASYKGHKASPGKYSFTLKNGGQNISASADILPNPLYSTNPAANKEYNQTMSALENELMMMHTMVNEIYEKETRLESLLKSLPDDAKFASVKKNGEMLLKKMKAWDEDMVQRKSKAYDDVENFPNKFTANYLYLINQTEGDIPRVNQPSLDLMKEMNAQWADLKARGNEILSKDIPAINKQFWEAGTGAVWEE